MKDIAYEDFLNKLKSIEDNINDINNAICGIYNRLDEKTQPTYFGLSGGEEHIEKKNILKKGEKMDKEKLKKLIDDAEKVALDQLNKNSDENMTVMKKITGECKTAEDMLNLIILRHNKEEDTKKLNWILYDEIPRLRQIIDQNDQRRI